MKVKPHCSTAIQTALFYVADMHLLNVLGCRFFCFFNMDIKTLHTETFSQLDWEITVRLKYVKIRFIIGLMHLR